MARDEFSTLYALLFSNLFGAGVKSLEGTICALGVERIGAVICWRRTMLLLFVAEMYLFVGGLILTDDISEVVSADSGVLRLLMISKIFGKICSSSLRRKWSSGRGRSDHFSCVTQSSGSRSQQISREKHGLLRLRLGSEPLRPLSSPSPFLSDIPFPTMHRQVGTGRCRIGIMTSRSWRGLMTIWCLTNAISPIDAYDSQAFQASNEQMDRVWNIPNCDDVTKEAISEGGKFHGKTRIAWADYRRKIVKESIYPHNLPVIVNELFQVPNPAVTDENGNELRSEVAIEDVGSLDFLQTKLSAESHLCLFGVAASLYFYTRYLAEMEEDLDAAFLYHSLFDVFFAGSHPSLLENAEWGLCCNKVKLSSCKRCMVLLRSSCEYVPYVPPPPPLPSPPPPLLLLPSSSSSPRTSPPCPSLPSLLPSLIPT